ncbi:DNA-directed RNA polymerase I subunit RPA43 [Heterocephalus glaber]|uniref:DNA-directed RNA polymerase I subunit RPA43 n=1 Tax=Heterocephalus glaber TaxID=10181 RepID=G5C7R6_HETGA|nr:DNA-directed RNA polymerase I subunit RPA43 [Heterocephalus glaber]
MAAGSSEAPLPKGASEGLMVGPAGPLPCLELPTYAAACALANSRCSCLVARPHRRHIALLPRYLNRKHTGIQEQLDAKLQRYSESLLGVPIAYDNIKVVGILCMILWMKPPEEPSEEALNTVITTCAYPEPEVQEG